MGLNAGAHVGIVLDSTWNSIAWGPPKSNNNTSKKHDTKNRWYYIPFQQFCTGFYMISTQMDTQATECDAAPSVEGTQRGVLFSTHRSQKPSRKQWNVSHTYLDASFITKEFGYKHKKWLVAISVRTTWLEFFYVIVSFADVSVQQDMLGISGLHAVSKYSSTYRGRRVFDLLLYV